MSVGDIFEKTIFQIVLVFNFTDPSQLTKDEDFCFFFEVGNQKCYEDSRTLTFSHPKYRSSEEKRAAHL